MRAAFNSNASNAFPQCPPGAQKGQKNSPTIPWERIACLPIFLKQAGSCHATPGGGHGGGGWGVRRQGTALGRPSNIAPVHRPGKGHNGWGAWLKTNEVATVLVGEAYAPSPALRCVTTRDEILAPWKAMGAEASISLRLGLHPGIQVWQAFAMPNSLV